MAIKVPRLPKVPRLLNEKEIWLFKILRIAVLTLRQGGCSVLFGTDTIVRANASSFGIRVDAPIQTGACLSSRP